MSTRRSKNIEILKNTVYSYQKDQDNIYYLLYKDENQKYKLDQKIKFYELSMILEEKEISYFVPDEKPTIYTLNEILNQIVEASHISKNIKGKKYNCVKISDTERLRIEKIFQQIEEAKIAKKDPQATQQDLLKQRAIEKAEEKQRQKEEEEEEKKKKEQERLQKNPNFKIGQHNKNIKKIPENTQQFEGNSQEFDYECCPSCANKELLRAVTIGDTDLFQKILKSEEKITTLGVMKAFDDSIGILETIFKNNDLQMLKILIDFLQNKKNQLKLADYNYSVRNSSASTYNQKFVSTWGWNQNFPQKELNGALTYDQYFSQEIFSSYNIDQLFKYEVDQEMWDYLRIYQEQSLDDVINQNLGKAVQFGNRKLAAQLIEFINTKRSGWGYNQLHLETLTKDRAEDIYEFKTQSIIKTPLSNIKVTPLHCACINPNPDILKRILTQQDQSQYTDEQLRKLTHYAAACSGPGPLKYLVEEKGLNPMETESYHGYNSLHVACQLGRAKNVEFLLSKKEYHNFETYTYYQESALHLAARSGDLGTVKALVENNCPVDQTYFQNKKNALHIAAAYGHLDIVQYLLKKQKKMINEVDKQGKSPLIHAVINNQTPVVAYLLQQGADYDQADSSGNTPIHFAAAYGYYESVDLLYLAGCDLNYYNDWSITPLCIALVKGHNKIVQQLLNFDKIDVNCVDDQGYTLLYLETNNFLQSEKAPSKHFQKFEFLLKKQADPNIPNRQGQTPLFLLTNNIDNIVQNWAVKDQEHPLNPKNKFYLKIRKDLKLSDKEIIPQKPEYRIYYKEAENSKFVQENLEHFKKHETNQIYIDQEKTNFIEKERARLEQEKSREIFLNYLEKYIIKLINLFLEYGADITYLNGKNQAQTQSPLSQAFLQLQNQSQQYKNLEVIKNLLENCKKPVLLENAFKNQDPYHQILFIFKQYKEDLSAPFELLKKFLEIDENKKQNLNQPQPNGGTIYYQIILFFQFLEKQTLSINDQKYLFLVQQAEKNNENYQKRIDEFKQLIDLLVENGFDPSIRNQRFQKQLKKKGPYLNRQKDDKDLDAELQKQEEEEEKQKDKMEEEEDENQDENEDEQDKQELENQKKLEQERKQREQEIQKYNQNYYKIVNDFGSNGEQNVYFALVESNINQDIQFELIKFFKEKYDVDTNHRDIQDYTPLHYQLNKKNTINLNILEFFIKNTKFSHQFRYTNCSGYSMLHTIFYKNYLPYNTQIQQYKEENPNLTTSELQAKYYKEFNNLIFSIPNINKCFYIKNHQGETPLMILVKQSQSVHFQGEENFRQIIQNPQVIKSIQETQTDKTTCLHHLFAQGIQRIDNLTELLKNGGHQLLNTQRSFIVLKGRKPNKTEIQRADLANPLHYLINTGNLTQEILSQILTYQEGKKALLQKDIKNQLPMHALVQCGYAPSLLKDLLIPSQINALYLSPGKNPDPSKRALVNQEQQLLRTFLINYPENERTVPALKNLLQNGADVHFKHPEDFQNRDNFFLALLLKKFKFVAAMAQAGYDINAFFYTYKTVKYAVKKEDFYIVKRQIHQELNPLLVAVQNNDEENVRNFLELGADPNKPNHQGKTALIVACETHKNTQIINLLLNKGAQITQDNFQKNPLQYTFQNLHLKNLTALQKPDQNLSEIHIYENRFSSTGFITKQIDQIVQLLNNQGYDNSNQDPTLVFNMLIKNNEKFINQQDNTGKSLIHYMALTNGAMALRFLVKNHKESSNLNLKDKFLNTPLSLAMLNKNQEVAKILIEAGADPSLPAYVHRDDPTTSKYFPAPRKQFNEEDWSDLEDEEDLDIRKEKEKQRQKLKENDKEFQEINIFQLSISNGWQAICSLLNEYNFDLQMACESAFRSFNFQLARNLLFKQEQVELENIKLNQNGQNLLHIFAETGKNANNKRLIKKLYQEISSKKIDPNLQDTQGKTPLMYAAQNDFVYLVKHLIKDHKVDLNIQDTSGKTALHYAIQHNKYETTQKIIDLALSQLDLSLQDANGKTVLHPIFKQYLSKNRGQKLVFDFQITPEILKKFPKESDRQKYLKKLQEDFFQAQKNKEPTRCQKQFNALLSQIQKHPKKTQILNAQDKNGKTLLYLAIKHQNVFAIRELVENQVDLNLPLTHKKKNSPLLLAAQMPAHDYFHFLIRSGLEINLSLQNQEKNNALHLAAQHNLLSIFEKLPYNFPINEQNSNGETALLLAIKHKNVQFYRKLILNFKADKNLASSDNYLPLHYAAYNNDMYAIQLLLQNAKTQLINSDFNSPIGEALKQKHYLAAAKLIYSNQFDLSREYVTTYTIKRTEFLQEQDKIDGDEKQQLQDNYNNKPLLKERKFIFDIETKKEVVKGKKREVYYLKTATVTPLLLFLVKKNLLENPSYLVQPQPSQSQTKMTQQQLKILEESGALPLNQSEYAPEIQEPRPENLILELLKQGQSPYQQNHKGQYLLITAITHNETFLLKALLKHVKDISLFQNLQHNFNPIHYCIEPIEYGSYQNVAILKALIDKKFDINQKTDKGFTPLDMALLQDHNKLAKILEENGAQKAKTKLNIQRGGTSIIKEQQWNKQEFDPNEDSVKYLDYLIEKHRIVPEEHAKPLPEASNSSQISSFSNDQPELVSDKLGAYDCLLTKVDSKKGQWGTNVYHRMQLLFSPYTRRFFIFEKWGDIGENGQTKSSPFQHKSDAVKEFEKIFLEKTGNNWKKRLNFEKQEKMYNFHAPIERLNIDKYIKPFDFKGLEEGNIYGKQKIKSQLQQKTILSIMKEIINFRKIQQEYQKLNIEQDLFNLDPEILQEGKQILTQIQENVDELKDQMANLIEADIDKILELKEQIGDLTNDYYSIIPEKIHFTQTQPFIDNYALIQQKQSIIHKLQNLEATAKIIAGAHCQLHYKNVHPADYTFQALQIRIHSLENNHKEFKLVQKYIAQTNKHIKIANIFALERKGEAEMMESYKHFENRQLLFHPTNQVSLLAALSEGIQPTLEKGGQDEEFAYMFGHGIYFTDSFQNTLKYIKNNNWQQLQVKKSIEEQRQINEQLIKQKQQNLQNYSNYLQTFNENNQSELDSEADSYNSDEEESIVNQDQLQNFSQNNQSDSENKNYKYVFLCEVALGEQQIFRQYTQLEGLDQQFQSVKGEGKHQPNDKNTIVLANGVKVPCGHMVRADIKAYQEFQKEKSKLNPNSQKFKDFKFEEFLLDYNQHVVFNHNQVRIRYLVQFEEEKE